MLIIMILSAATAESSTCSMPGEPAGPGTEQLQGGSTGQALAPCGVACWVPLVRDAVIAGMNALSPREHGVESRSQSICPQVPLLNHPKYFSDPSLLSQLRLVEGLQRRESQKSFLEVLPFLSCCISPPHLYSPSR